MIFDKNEINEIAKKILNDKNISNAKKFKLLNELEKFQNKN